MRKRTLILLGTSFLLFVVAAIIRFTSFNQMREYTRQVELSRELIVSLEKLSNHLKSAQIFATDSSRGNLYNFYKHNKVDRKTIQDEVTNIGSLVQSRSQKQQQYWKVVAKTVAEQLPILLQKNIREIENSADSWRLGALLRINTYIHNMVTLEELQLDAQKAQLQSALFWSDAVSLALVLISLVIFGVTFTHNLKLTRKERWLEGFLASVLNTSQAGIVSYRAVRDRGRLIRFEAAYRNDAVATLLGIPNAEPELLQQKLELFITEAGLFQQFCNVVETGNTVTLESSYEGPEEKRWLQLLLARRDDGVTLSMHDISTIKQYQEDLKTSIGQLERSNAELEQYAYAASHDLQEPLRKITTFGHLLSDTQAARLDEKGKQYLDKILSSAGRMSTLIRDLLNFSSLKREASFEPVHLSDVLDSVLQDLELAIAQNDARVTSDRLPEIDAITLQMHQLFFNLINNALKFASPNRRPEIRITCSSLNAAERASFGLQEDRQYIKLMIADNGIGFEKNHAKQIFGLFKRLNNRELYSGSGIGLALCKRVVDNHLGHIFAEGQEGYGARFYILIPTTHPNTKHQENSLRNIA